MSEHTLLAVENLAVDFEVADRVVPALRGVSFDMARGEVLGIVGESGSGKTVACRSILRLLAANARIRSGSIRLDGQDVLALDQRALKNLRGETAAMIFQNPSTHLDPLMRVGRQVGEALQVHHRVGSAKARRQAIALLAEMRIPEPERRVDAYAHQLSGGMRQRVMIAAALACRPRLLIADEPTTALDVTIQAQILELLQRIRRERDLSIILVSHDLGVVAQMCDRIIVMRGGEVVESGQTRQILERPNAAYTRALIGSHPSLLGPAREHAETMAPGPPILSARRVSVRFREGRGVLALLGGKPAHEVQALADVSFSLAPGETLGVVGESGSGKSTLARAIVGLVKVDEGEIAFQGRPVGGQSSEDRVRFQRAVQMVFQDPFTSLNPMFTVAQTLAEPLRRHRLCREREVAGRIEELVRRVELSPDLLRRRTGQLSGGQRQRVGIARALALQPKVIIADEVTSALDVTIQAQILELFKALRDAMNLALMLISHDLAVVRHLCQRVMVMRNGHVVESGPTERIFSEPADPYTRELLSAIPRLPRTAAVAAQDGA